MLSGGVQHWRSARLAASPHVPTNLIARLSISRNESLVMPARAVLTVHEESLCLRAAAAPRVRDDVAPESSPRLRVRDTVVSDSPLPTKPSPVDVPGDVPSPCPSPSPRRVYLSTLPYPTKRPYPATPPAALRSKCRSPFTIRVDTPLRARYYASDDGSDSEEDEHESDVEDDSSVEDSPVAGRRPMGEIGNLYEWTA